MKIKEKKPHLLIYAHYYYPDVASTGQILKELAEGLLEDFKITVICVVPSYTGKIEACYKNFKYYQENINGVEVIRIRVPEFDKQNKMSRVKNILVYFLRSMWATFKVRKVDYVYSVSQPPIVGGLLGVWGKWVKKAKFIYNIQDFNPEQVIVTSYSKNKIILKLMMCMDKFSCKQSSKVIVVGRDMIETLKKRFEGTKMPHYTFINNWIDEKEIYPLPQNHSGVLNFKKKYNLDNQFIIMYSGNIGLYYDLEELLKIIQKFPNGTKTSDGREVTFAFIGAGSVLEKLVRYKEEKHLDNVMFIPYQNKEDLIYSLNAGDVHWCVNAKGIKGVSVPSKCYGIMAVGRPVLGVLENESEAQLLIEESGCGLCCEPCDYEAVEEEIKWFIDHAGTQELITMGQKGVDYLVKYLKKDVSIKKYAEEILKC